MDVCLWKKYMQCGCRVDSHPDPPGDAVHDDPGIDRNQ